MQNSQPEKCLRRDRTPPPKPLNRDQVPKPLNQVLMHRDRSRVRVLRVIKADRKDQMPKALNRVLTHKDHSMDQDLRVIRAVHNKVQDIKDQRHKVIKEVPSRDRDIRDLNRRAIKAIPISSQPQAIREHHRRKQALINTRTLPRNRRTVGIDNPYLIYRDKASLNSGAFLL